MLLTLGYQYSGKCMILLEYSVLVCMCVLGSLEQMYIVCVHVHVLLILYPPPPPPALKVVEDHALELEGGQIPLQEV